MPDRRNILEIWSKMFSDLEKTRGEIRWRFGEDVFGDLEKTYSVIFGKNVLAIWRNRSAILEKTVWRLRWRFGETWSVQLWLFRIGVHYGVA